MFYLSSKSMAYVLVTGCCSGVKIGANCADGKPVLPVGGANARIWERILVLSAPYV